MLKVQEIRELIKLIDDSSINEFKYESNGTKVTLKKQDGKVMTPSNGEKQPVVESQSPVQKPVQHTEPEAPKVEAKKTVEESKQESVTTIDYDKEIVSPMVGTFYSASSPEADPYVQVGDTVKKDSVVCIVEAMKLFNEIEAEVPGDIVEILAEDGQLVEYGQPLFRVKTK